MDMLIALIPGGFLLGFLAVAGVLYGVGSAAAESSRRAEFAHERRERAWVVVGTLRCKGCGIVFRHTEGQHRFYVSRGLKLPTHCRRCRDVRRLAQHLASRV
jgi:hypothetical protein